MPRRVYIDTNFVIRFIENRDERLASVLDRTESGSVELVTSELSLAEVLVHPLQSGDERLADLYEAFLTSDDGIDVCPIDRPVLRLAAEIRAQHRDKLPDAIHLATAIRQRCAIFISSDRRLTMPPGMLRLGRDDLVDRWP